MTLGVEAAAYKITILSEVSKLRLRQLLDPTSIFVEALIYSFQSDASASHKI